MKITIELTEENLKSNIVLQSLKQMLQANTTINIDNSIKQNKAISTPNTDFEDIIPDWANNAPKSNENTQKSKGKTKEERITELKKYANSIWKDLSDAKKKSLKKFVEFYTDKIEKENFTINVENQVKKWFERDKNLK